MPDSTLPSPSPGAKASSPRTLIADLPGFRATRGYICAMGRPTIEVAVAAAPRVGGAALGTHRSAHSAVGVSRGASTDGIVRLLSREEVPAALSGRRRAN